MAGIRLWPAGLPSWFDGLDPSLSGITADVSGFDLSDPLDDGATVVLILVGEAEEVASGLQWMSDLDVGRSLNVIVVTFDSHLGSDLDRGTAQHSGAAIAAVRSLAVKRGTKVRANAICLPEWTVSAEGSELRGPLPQQPELRDVVDAIEFLAGSDAGYLSGQVLFVDSGRQLFSSLTS